MLAILDKVQASHTSLCIQLYLITNTCFDLNTMIFNRQTKLSFSTERCSSYLDCVKYKEAVNTLHSCLFFKKQRKYEHLRKFFIHTGAA